MRIVVGCESSYAKASQRLVDGTVIADSVDVVFDLVADEMEWDWCMNGGGDTRRPRRRRGDPCR